jgi:selenide,water dikinase
MKRLMLLGGGRAHVQVLRQMAEQPLPGVQAVLVSPFSRHLHSALLPALVAGHLRAEEAAIPLEPLARAARVELAVGHAVALDAAQRLVTLADGRAAHFDVLSIDIDAAGDRERIAGAREHALFSRPAEHVVRLLDEVLALAARRVLDVVVLGGDAEGFELALALQHRLAGQGEERARVCLVASEGMLPTVSAGVRRRALDALRAARVTVFNETCVEITGTHVVLASGARLACDVPVVALPPAAPPWLATSGLALDPLGRVLTGPSLQSHSHPAVFAVGDMAAALPAPLPAGADQAEAAGPTLALNLRRALAGGELAAWQPRPPALTLLGCGARQAIMGWREWSLQGAWAWRWQQRRALRFVVRQRSLPASGAALPAVGAPGPSPAGQRSTQFPTTVQESRSPSSLLPEGESGTPG